MKNTISMNPIHRDFAFGKLQPDCFGLRTYRQHLETLAASVHAEHCKRVVMPGLSQGFELFKWHMHHR